MIDTHEVTTAVEQSASIRIGGGDHKGRKRRRPGTLRPILGFLVWSYVLVKVFVYDIDRAMLSAIAPDATVILDYRLFIGLPVVATCWLALGTKRFTSLITYLLFFPLIVAFWTLFKAAVEKGGTRIMAIGFLLLENVQYLRWRFAASAFGLLAVVAILSDLHPVTTGLGIGALYVVLVFHLYRRTTSALRSPSYFRRIRELVRDKADKVTDFLTRELPPIPTNASDEEADNIAPLFINAVVVNRLSLYGACALRRLLDGPSMIYYFVILVIQSYALLVLVSGLQFYGLARIDPDSFQASVPVSLAECLFFSATNSLKMGGSGLLAASGLAKVMALVEVGTSMLIGAVVFWALFSIRRDKCRNEIEGLINQLRLDGSQLDDQLEQRTGLRIAQVVMWLKRVKNNGVHLIMMIDRGLEEDDRLRLDEEDLERGRQQITVLSK